MKTKKSQNEIKKKQKWNTGFPVKNVVIQNC